MNKSKILCGIAGAAVLATLTSTRAADPAGAIKAAGPTSSQAADLFPDKVVAKGKGVEIKRSELDNAFSLLSANAAQNGQPIPPDRRSALESRLLERLIVTKLLLAKAAPEDKTKAAEEAGKHIEQFRKQSGSEEMFERQLKALGRSLETIRKDLTEQATCESVLDRDLRSKIKISDDEAKKFYEENPNLYSKAEQVRAAHVLIGTRDNSAPAANPQQKPELPEAQKLEKHKLAQSIVERARKGEDFAKLAKEFSEDPGSKDKGGEYTFPRGQMVPEFEAAAFSLDPGKVSDIVTTTYGYHIIKTLEKIPAKKLELVEVTDDIKKGLQNRELQKQAPAYIEKLKQECAVEILDEELKAQGQAKPPMAPAPSAPAGKK